MRSLGAAVQTTVQLCRDNNQLMQVRAYPFSFVSGRATNLHKAGTSGARQQVGEERVGCAGLTSQQSKYTDWVPRETYANGLSFLQAFLSSAKRLLATPPDMAPQLFPQPLNAPTTTGMGIAAALQATA